MQKRLFRAKNVNMNIGVLLIADALTSTITGPVDVLTSISLAYGELWQAKIVSTSEETVRSFNGIELKPTALCREKKTYDLVIIPSILVGNNGFLNNFDDEIEWIKTQYNEGASIAAICTGNFILAASQITNTLELTTHWQFSKLLATQFPNVTIKDNQSLICHERILSCSAGTAWHDMVLHILKVKLGEAAAVEAIQLFQLQNHNLGQEPAKGISISPTIEPLINKSLELIKENFSKNDCLELVVNKCGITARTFQRKFKQETGMTAIAYLQHYRVEKAKELLIYSSMPVEHISSEVGYEDSSYLRRIFKRQTNMSLNEYRKRFAVIL